MMSKKGFVETLLHLESKSPQYYNDILHYLQDTKIISSRASIAAVLNNLSEMGLIDRQELTNTRPMRTRYTISKKGRIILECFRQIESQLGLIRD